MILVWDHRRPRRERPFVTPSVTPSVAPPNSSPPPKSEIFEQPDKPPGPKSPADTSVPKYFKDDLQQIFKVVLEAWVSTPASALAPVVSKVP